MSVENIIAIIPARGGSKRIPRKNIKDFLGKPIIAYSIEAAVKSGIFDEIMVSTDDTEIADIAKQFGAKIPFMRDGLADDFSTADEVLVDVLKKYQAIGREFKWMCCIYATAPFVNVSDLIRGYDLIKKHPEATQVLPMVPFSYPPQRCHVIGNDGLARMKYPEHVATRSQDLETWYHDIGQYYFYNAGEFIEKKGQIIDGILPLIVDEKYAQDIDTLKDWEIAEMKYKFLFEGRS